MPAAVQGLLSRWHLILYLVPFAHEFHKCSLRDFREAGTEALITTVFSTMPLWIMPVLGPIIFSTDISFVDHLLGTIRGGELFVYCAALVGPLIYIITRRYGEVSRDNNRFSFSIQFPHGVAFVLFSALICLFAGFAFSLMKNPVFIPKETSVKFNPEGIFWASTIVYFFSLYCIFSASAYRNAMSGFVRDGRFEEDAFSAAWEKRGSNGKRA
jgi:hypothetical protein